MNLRPLVLIFTALASFGTLQAGQKKLTIQAWLAKRHAQLAAIEAPASSKRSKLDQSEAPNREGFYRLYPGNGLLEFADGSWILLTSHSAHAEDGLPDVSLIRTSTGDYYYNLGHCCLPILLFSKDKVATLEGFLKTTGKGPNAEPTAWVKWVREQGGAAQPAGAAESKPEGNGKPEPDTESESATRPQ